MGGHDVMGNVAIVVAVGLVLYALRHPLVRLTGLALRGFGLMAGVMAGLAWMIGSPGARWVTATALGCWTAGHVVFRLQEGHWRSSVLGGVARLLGGLTRVLGWAVEVAFDRRPAPRRVGQRDGDRGSAPSGSEFGTSVGGAFSVGDVFWAEVPFEDTDQVKDRPVVVIGAQGRDTLVCLSLTSKPDHRRPGPFSGSWSTPTAPRSWVRVDRPVAIHRSSVRRRSGHMHERDFEQAMWAYRARHSGV